MHPGARRRSADPLALAIGQRRAAIQAHGPLEHPPGPAGLDPMDEGAVLMSGVNGQHTADHLQPRIPQSLQSTAGNAGVGIGERHHHPPHSSGKDRFSAGRRAAVMAARLQGDDDRAASGGVTGLGQGNGFSVGLTGTGMKPLTNQAPFGIEHHRTHEGIGAGMAFGEGGELKRPAHPGQPGLLRAADGTHQLSGWVCTSRHSATT